RQNAARAQPFARRRIELLRIEHARSCSFDWRRRINRNHIVLLWIALQVAAAVVDDHLRERRSQKFGTIAVKIAEEFRYAWHQFDCRRVDLPAKQGAE